MEWKRKEGKERRRRNKADEEREEVETRSSGKKKKKMWRYNLRGSTAYKTKTHLFKK